MAERDDSPSKKRKAAEVDDYDENRELEATPRASRHGISIPLSSARSSQSTATRSPTKSSTSARSSSPVKRMADMVLRPAPTVLREFLRDYSSLPPDVREMLLRIQQFDRGIAVISPGCREEIARSNDDIFAQIDRYAYASSEDADLYGPSPSPRAVAKIIRRASQCEEDGHSEPSWNCLVHTYILDLALDNDEYRGEVDFLNCTTAQIQPRDLIQADHAGRPGESKMIDFAIYIEPDEGMLEAMRAMAARRPYETASVNHTWHTPLIPRPVSVSLETKRTGEGWDKAVVQSGIWAAAHIAKLSRLVADVGGDPKTIPALPLVVVQGHDWYFLVASAGEHGRTNIWSKARFGTTSTALGVYQIVATIQYLAHWTRTVYRPWFSKMALGLEIPTVSDTSTTSQTPEPDRRRTSRAKGNGKGRGRGRGKGKSSSGAVY